MIQYNTIYNTIQYTIQWSQHYSRYAYNATELATVTLRDVANADYAVQKLANLSTDAASGTQPFFFVMGFHKVRPRDIVMFRPEFNASTAAPPAVRCASGVL